MGAMSTLRREAAPAGGGLGLGWLLAISIGGAILVFSAFGLLLSWRLKSHDPETTTTVYETTEAREAVTTRRHFFSRPAFTKRLTKRRYVMAESNSRLTLTLPPVLPPLPTYQSFGFFSGNRKRSRSWVDEDMLHGPRVTKSIRDSWFKRDSWIGRIPTLPSFMLDDAEKGKRDVKNEEADKPQTSQRENETELKSILKPSRTVSEAAGPAEEEEIELDEPLRAPEPVRVRTASTDLDLRDILRSTEQRLREGRSQSLIMTTPSASPVKGSPSKMSPTKTHYSTPSQDSIGTVQITRVTPSPEKRATIHSCSVPHSHGRIASVDSIGSIANSLLAEVAQELELPGGLSSPSRLRGREWKENEEEGEVKEEVPKKQRSRSDSAESRVSSSLSTLYSVGDVEERQAEGGPSSTSNDPFVDRNHRSNLYGPRSIRRDTFNNGLGITSPPTQQPPAIRYSMQHPSYSVQAVGGVSSPTIMLDPAPRQAPSYNSTNSQIYNGEVIGLAFPVSPSITSMVTPSVTTVSDDSDITIGPVNEEPTSSTPRQSANPTSPSTATSSPFDENQILNLLLAEPHKRALPEPPRHIAYIDQAVMPMPLSPRPRRDCSQQLRKISASSMASSIYHDEIEDSVLEDPATVSTGSPARRSSRRGTKEFVPSSLGELGTVGSTVAELRRMNSVLSSYSVASATSTVYGDLEEPTLPALRGGGCSPARTHARMGSIGRQNYLNFGSPPKKTNSRRLRLSDRRRSSNNSFNAGVIAEKPSSDPEAKENQGPTVEVMPVAELSESPEPIESPPQSRDTRREARRIARARQGIIGESQLNALREAANADRDGLKDSSDLANQRTRSRR